MARKLLAMIQGDYENFMQGLGSFRMEKYTRKGWTDVVEYFEKWLQTKRKKKPATYKGYKSYFECHIKPFFRHNPVMLHEIQLDTLDKLLDSLCDINTRAKKDRCPACKADLGGKQSCYQCGWAAKPLSGIGAGPYTGIISEYASPHFRSGTG